MDYDESQIQSLAELGKALEDVDWRPEKPRPIPFSKTGGNSLVEKALAYLEENQKRIQDAVCKGNSVKPEVVAAGSTVASVLDALDAAGGFDVPVWNIANVLCALGLTKLCER